MNAVKGFFGRWLGHLVGYVGAGAGIVAAINPTLLPPQGKLIVGIASLAVLTAHHGYTAGQLKAAAIAALNAATPGAPPASVATAVVDAASKALSATPVALIAVLCMGLGLSGCATVQGWLSSPAAPVVVTAAVDIAVATAEQKGVSAAQINSIAKQALAADQGTGATLAAVASLVNARIAQLNLPPLDVAAAQILETALSAAIQAKIGNNADLATAQTALAAVLADVIAATGG